MFPESHPDNNVDEKFPLNSVLQPLMKRAGLSTWVALSRASGVSAKQLRRVRQGQLAQLRMATLFQIAAALQISPSELLCNLNGDRSVHNSIDRSVDWPAQSSYDPEPLHRESLDRLESWLRYWPVAAAKVAAGANVKPSALIKLVKPVEQLIESWGVETIAAVGDRLPYNPQWHQLAAGTVEPGTPVTVISPGYRYRGKLLFRAEVER
ncbi:helix-turn-helix domain-containing protein [Roseofilum casamattae]|uniref:Helix-turn-helix domain-containing protein n=1 Tax=Roseofilum casamattae BLCC-M143 TaxID=3022442 RepID=A0ABT7BT38_9CYAN|nr:helix-turn-helix domain-containing protein [Roseofilum casamattae]MDJ1182355.1 helix-turn-helix domain-containing protein [Roseofilum casamattae BLCC-M143]